MKRALVLNAINPRIGGVLIRGEKGTAKSHGRARPGQPAARDRGRRGLRTTPATRPPRIAGATTAAPAAPVAPPPKAQSRAGWGTGAFPRRRGSGNRSAPDPTDMRMGASASRPSVAACPSSSCPSARPRTASWARSTWSARSRKASGTSSRGCWRRANRGILYVDEVNLLNDHLVDVLLDAAAMGVNYVEREGMSVAASGPVHPGRHDEPARRATCARSSWTASRWPWRSKASRDPAAARRGRAPAHRLRGRPARLRGGLGGRGGAERARILAARDAAAERPPRRPHAGPDRRSSAATSRSTACAPTS